MKQMLCIIFCVIGFGKTYCQQISNDLISTSGNYDSNDDNQISWIIGESFTETLSNSENTLTQGFLQTNLEITSINEFQIKELEIEIFPNPTNEILNIIYINNENDELYYSITNLNGKIISIGSIVEHDKVMKQIDFTNYNSGIYIITFSTKKLNQSFQIIKK